jgi:hypothetical protein
MQRPLSASLGADYRMNSGKRQCDLAAIYTQKRQIVTVKTTFAKPESALSKRFRVKSECCF